MERAEQLPPLDHDVLMDPVRRALGGTTADVTAWECQVLHGGYGIASGGVYHVAGSAHDQGATVPWSLVLKIVCPPRPGGSFLAKNSPDDAHITPGGLTYWKREVEAYQSGLLDDLPASLVAPRCYGVRETTGTETWLWLEHIADHSETHWTLEYHGLVAHHLGCFNGAFLARPPAASGPWLPNDSLQGWVDYATGSIARLPQVVEHPLLRRFYPPQVAAALLELWDERQALLDALARLPQTLCHSDAWRRNLMVRPGADARTQVVAIDWACVGMGPIGQELVMFVANALDFFQVDVAQARALDEVVFAGYLEGLREAGWQGNPELVRFGYTAAMSIRRCLGTLPLNVGLLLNERDHAYLEQEFGASIDILAEQWGPLEEVFLGYAAEARSLLHRLW